MTVEALKGSGPMPAGAALRTMVVAGIGGLIIGHIAWLVGISLVIATGEVERWVLIQSAIIAVIAAVLFTAGWLLYRRGKQAWGAFLLCLPVSPVLLTLVLLGVLYL